MLGNTFGSASMSKIHSTEENVADRLYKNEQKVKIEKTANDALLTTLPTPTLRFLKKRRKLNSFDKVPLTYYREKQLRAIFNGLDFDKMGTIHLDLVTDAAIYAEEKLKPKKGEPVFKNIKRMFEAMDEDGNGDGEVDFHEFTIAMTGSTKSTVDSASEYDVERLTKRFVEFANIRRREHALDVINDIDATDATATSSPRSQRSLSPRGTVGAVVKSPSGTPRGSLPSPASLASPTSATPASGDDSKESTSAEPTTHLPFMIDTLPPLEVNKASLDSHKIERFRTCFSVFNSRVSDESVEAEINAYYEAKGIKRAKVKVLGPTKVGPADTTSAAGASAMSPNKSTTSVAAAGLTTSVNFKDQALRTQEILDFFLADIDEFSKTEVSPAFAVKRMEEISAELAAENITLTTEKVVEPGSPKVKHPPKKSDDDEDDVPKGLEVQVLTPLEEINKRREEFLEIQKRKAKERIREAEERMVDLDIVENQERMDAERKYVDKINKKPWAPKPTTGSGPYGVPMYSGPIRRPTLIPLNSNSAAGIVCQEMRMRVQTRREIMQLKLDKMRDRATGIDSNAGVGTGINTPVDAEIVSIGAESSTLFSIEKSPIRRIKSKKRVPKHGIVINF